MPLSPSISARNLTVSIVLHHSDLRILGATLISLCRAIESLPIPVSLVMLDQSLDAQYANSARVRCSQVLADTGIEWLFIESATNGGYGAGHNRACAERTADAYLVLNPDVELAGNALVSGLTALTEHTDVVAIAPRAEGSGGEEEYLAKRYPTLLVLVVRALDWPWLTQRCTKKLSHYELRDLAQQGPVQDVPLISGCCMLIRGAAFRGIEGFDERFFLYFEDYDLSLRLSRRGRVVRLPAMKIVHHGGKAARKGGRHIALFIRGAVRFFSIWGWRIF